MSIKTIRDDISGKILRALRNNAPLTMNEIAETSGVGVATVRRVVIELAAAQQVIQVGVVITEDGQRNRDTWAPHGWTPPYDKTAVNPDLLQPIMVRMARRRDETAVSLAIELDRPRAEVEATMACLAQSGKLTVSRVGPLSCYHMVVSA